MSGDGSVRAWPEFQQRWSELRNVLLSSDLTRGFSYNVPPLERIVEEVCADECAVMRSGIKSSSFDLTDISGELRRRSAAEALRTRFVLAHFDLHRSFGAPGQLFEGLEEQWVEPWRAQLRSHGFTFDRVFSILFAAGPHSATNYHMDFTHQLAWQQYGDKHWHALNEPDRWTTKALRYDTKSMLQLSKPAAVGARDIYTVVQRPGSALWNPQATPHWVETFSEPALTLTLVHAGLRLHGRLCPHEQEREDDLLTVRVPSLAAAGLLSSRSSERARY